MNLRVQILFLAILINSALSAKILGIFHAFAYSHQQIGSKLLHELAARGHEVVSIVPSPFASKTPIKNLKEIKLVLPEFENSAGGNLLLDPFKEAERGIIDKILFMDNIGLLFTDMFFNQTSVQNLLKSNEKFDLVIMEVFVNEAFMGFCYHYKAPCIGVNTVVPSRWTDFKMGNPINPSYRPDLFLSYSFDMNFCERFINIFVFVLATLNSFLFSLPKQNELMQKHFPGAPHITELYYNNSLMLTNSHVSISSAIPLVPNMIEIGGFHVNPPKPLPKDLKEYLDSAKDGAIYFSMGSHIKSKDMDEVKRDAILKVFAKLKQKVLWKWEDTTLPNQPKNVKLGKWIPQQDVLAHPNIKLFITHGGLLSTIEAIYHGVPIVGIPILGDQELNVANAEHSGYGLGVKFKTLTEESLRYAVTEVLNNPKYTENARMRSNIMHDQPMKPLDKAMFWIEYVLRHKGATHLRSSALNLRWFQLYCLDIIGFVVAILLIAVCGTCKIIKIVCKRKPKKIENQSKKKN